VPVVCLTRRVWSWEVCACRLEAGMSATDVHNQWWVNVAAPEVVVNATSTV
jgi:hypothetical protein